MYLLASDSIYLLYEVFHQLVHKDDPLPPFSAHFANLFWAINRQGGGSGLLNRFLLTCIFAAIAIVGKVCHPLASAFDELAIVVRTKDVIMMMKVKSRF
jgi:hypothetical protein